MWNSSLVLLTASWLPRVLTEILSATVLIWLKLQHFQQSREFASIWVAITHHTSQNPRDVHALTLNPSDNKFHQFLENKAFSQVEQSDPGCGWTLSFLEALANTFLAARSLAQLFILVTPISKSVKREILNSWEHIFWTFFEGYSRSSIYDFKMRGITSCRSCYVLWKFVVYTTRFPRDLEKGILFMAEKFRGELAPRETQIFSKREPIGSRSGTGQKEIRSYIKASKANKFFVEINKSGIG